MATDYDSPRKTDDDLTEDSLQELQARRLDKTFLCAAAKPTGAKYLILQYCQICWGGDQRLNGACANSSI